MSFHDPLHLAALAAIPLVVLVWMASRARRRRFAVRLPGVSAMKDVAAGRGRWRRVLPAALVGASAVSLAGAYAKPQRTVNVPIEKASVVLVSDESGSMAATDVSPSRLEASRSAAKSFLKSAPKSLLVGFAGYSSGVETNVAPTTDRDAIQSAIAAENADGGTATGDALQAALDQLAARKGSDGKTAPAAIVLLSDGQTTDGSDPVAAARRAKQLGIPIYTVALGTRDGVLQLDDGRQVSVPPDPQTLSEIASTSAGKAYNTDDADTLDAIYRTLGSKIGTKPVKREMTMAFVAGGLVLLLGGFGTGVRFRSTLT
ncbi:MAG TPA: VWA domain-containing protein [Baekduia sp.]|uniref:VWA domain-containing protein n=1 Tax=Baekduia sp. TaxID=2600305 RepID=UPI002D77A7F4|nr:VWA domain-containing protein [Baekduia sp.]HET6510245.1 VWA domain-containing protein [Baekduia sp.]